MAFPLFPDWSFLDSRLVGGRMMTVSPLLPRKLVPSISTRQLLPSLTTFRNLAVLKVTVPSLSPLVFALLVSFLPFDWA